MFNMFDAISSDSITFNEWMEIYRRALKQHKYTNETIRHFTLICMNISYGVA